MKKINGLEIKLEDLFELLKKNSDHIPEDATFSDIVLENSATEFEKFGIFVNTGFLRVEWISESEGTYESRDVE